MDSLMLRRRAVNLNLDTYIDFADPIVADMCKSAWGDAIGLTRRHAIFVNDTQFRSVFDGTETRITSFDEMRYFAMLYSVPANAFKGCEGLTSITIPSGVTTIYGFAFQGCTSLESINLYNITTLLGGSFQNCSSLAIEIDVPNLTTFNSYDTFNGSGITRIKNLGSITSLGYYSNFKNCKSLTHVVLPNTLTSMGRQQFEGCSNLETVVIYATTPPSVANQNFRDAGNAKIYVPYSEDHSIIASYQSVWGANAGADQYDVPRLYELDENGEIPE